MQLLDLRSGEAIVQLYQKGMSKEAWPALQLSADEELLAHMVNNTVNIYKTRAFAEGSHTFADSEQHTAGMPCAAGDSDCMLVRSINIIQDSLVRPQSRIKQ